MKCTLGGVLSLLFLAGAAHAQTPADRAFSQCGAIADAGQRLACYDAARDQSKATHWPEFGPAQSAPPSAAARAPAPPPPVAARAPTPAPGKLVSHVAQYSFSPHGQFTVVLDNGEIWRQLDSDDGVAQFRHAGGNIVQISRGFWGSYDLKLNATNVVFKVTRIK